MRPLIIFDYIENKKTPNTANSKKNEPKASKPLKNELFSTSIFLNDFLTTKTLRFF